MEQADDGQRQAELISIVVPTCERPELLLEAICSCFDQDYRPLEILIGDDSRSDTTSSIVGLIDCPEGVTLRYLRNRPGLGQAGNVNRLFTEASGSRLLLLHDDDFLCPGGLDALVRCWSQFADADCVFGKQIVVSSEGEPDLDLTIELSSKFTRYGIETGPQTPPDAVGYLQQIPNNAFLIDSALVRRTGYRTERDVGHLVDADFGIRVGLDPDAGAFVFVNEYVSAYRLSKDSILRTFSGNQQAHLAFAAIEGMPSSPQGRQAKAAFLARIASSAVLDAIDSGDIELARRIFRSEHYRLGRASPYRLLAVLSLRSRSLGMAIRPWARRLAKTHAGLTSGRRHRRVGNTDPEHEALAPAARKLAPKLGQWHRAAAALAARATDADASIQA